MMRAVAVFVIVVSGLAAIWMWSASPSSLPRQVVSEQLAEMASRQLPIDIRWKSMETSLDPPTVALEDCELRLKAGDPLLMTAERVVFQAEPGSLESGNPEIESILVEAPRLNVIRSASGWQPWNFFAERADAKSAGEKNPEPVQAEKAPASQPKASESALPILRIERGTVVFTDVLLDPAMEWTLENVEIRGVQEASDKPYEIVGSGDLSSGGTITLEGTWIAGGETEVALSFSDLVFSPLARYSKELSGLRSPISGMAKVLFVDSSWQSLSARLRSPKASLRVEEIKLRGALELSVQVRPDPLGGASGDFDLDATGAALNLADSYRKPAGSPAQVDGTFVFTRDGKLELDQVNLAIRKNRRGTPKSDAGKNQ